MIQTLDPVTTFNTALSTNPPQDWQIYRQQINANMRTRCIIAIIICSIALIAGLTPVILLLSYSLFVVSTVLVSAVLGLVFTSMTTPKPEQKVAMNTIGCLIGLTLLAIYIGIGILNTAFGYFAFYDSTVLILLLISVGRFFYEDNHRKNLSLLVLRPEGMVTYRTITSPQSATFLLDFATVDHLDISTKEISNTHRSTVVAPYAASRRETTTTNTEFYIDIYRKNRTVDRWQVNTMYDSDAGRLARAIVWMFKSGRH